jgi:DNA-binding CsgD family transcriptional regulator
VRTAQHRWAEVLEIAEDVNSTGEVANVGIVWRLEAAVAAARLGDRSTAAELLEQHRHLTERWRLPRQRAAWLRADALVCDGAARIAGLRRSVDVFEATPSRLEHARALLDLGAALRAGGERTEARQVLARAVDAAEGCGADRLVGLGQEELLAAGARPQRRRTTGVDALTASELRVARLAADGLTNPEIAQALFVTRKTVETQLSAAYRKLQIAGRPGLGQALERAQTSV